MSRRRAPITQADLERVLRAINRAGGSYSIEIDGGKVTLSPAPQTEIKPAKLENRPRL